METFTSKNSLTFSAHMYSNLNATLNGKKQIHDIHSHCLSAILIYEHSTQSTTSV